jgi:hypothetical protein
LLLRTARSLQIGLLCDFKYGGRGSYVVAWIPQTLPSSLPELKGAGQWDEKQ